MAGLEAQVDWEAFLLSRLQAGLVQKRWRDLLWGEGTKGSLQPRHLSEDRERATGRKKTRRGVKRRTVEEREEDGEEARRAGASGGRRRRKEDAAAAGFQTGRISGIPARH